ncbi:MAG: folylpolyglutamate synthase/dihydrofolate synthase family protein [Rubritalea sp.]|uniref:bifunctional folylpolyglutamate synthase/dihydrofolate synthase n=1 Tax=Rubritalea sp. TaxID=2109375 RepID=UPI003241DA10
MNYQVALEWLYSTQHFGIKLGLDGPKKLLRQLLANPTRNTKVIHLAGTNGKGSTSAIIDSLARATGLRCGLFTSPHLVDFRERMRVNGEMIPEQKVLETILEIKEIVADWEHHPTFFELTLAIAMRHFKEMECELIILETGMGGRLDATTAVPADVCVITPIALDHSEWLGDTLEKVAGEKAGIICEKMPVISAQQERSAAIVIAEEAEEKRAPLITVKGPLLGYNINLAGKHQAENAKLAVEAVTALGIQLDFDTVKYALASIVWPGRFETLSEQPQIIIDGAHNPHAAHALVETWKEKFGTKKATLIFGAVEEKDVGMVLEILCSISDDIHLTPLDSPRSLTTESAAAALPKNTAPTSHKNLESTLTSLREHTNPILIAGSLFLIGEAKALMGEGGFQRSSQ